MMRCQYVANTLAAPEGPHYPLNFINNLTHTAKQRPVFRQSVTRWSAKQ
jgi:hypothetical protein